MSAQYHLDFPRQEATGSISVLVPSQPAGLFPESIFQEQEGSSAWSLKRLDPKLGCEFTGHDNGGFGGIAVIGLTLSGFGETMLAVEVYRRRI